MIEESRWLQPTTQSLWVPLITSGELLSLVWKSNLVNLIINSEICGLLVCCRRSNGLQTVRVLDTIPKKTLEVKYEGLPSQVLFLAFLLLLPFFLDIILFELFHGVSWPATKWCVRFSLYPT